MIFSPLILIFILYFLIRPPHAGVFGVGWSARKKNATGMGTRHHTRGRGGEKKNSAALTDPGEARQPPARALTCGLAGLAP